MRQTHQNGPLPELPSGVGEASSNESLLHPAHYSATPCALLYETLADLSFEPITTSTPRATIKTTSPAPPSESEPEASESPEQQNSSTESEAAAYQSATEYTEQEESVQSTNIHIDPGNLGTAARQLLCHSVAEFFTILAVLDQQSQLVGKLLQPHQDDKGRPIALIQPQLRQ